MKIRVKRIITMVLSMVLMLTSVSISAFAGENAVDTNLSTEHGNINNNVELEKFMDDFFDDNMEKYCVPGASVVVVKDNKEVLKKGYGYSDLGNKIKVDPNKTKFPAASVSKLFTATAIMQLYEQRKIDLNKNIDNYIKPYNVINNYNEDVTCGNLLTHSSGVDEASEINGGTRDENAIKSQEYYMDNHIPRVVREPNTASRYSNEGYNLLGYIVEKTSGTSYEEYVKKNILEPLKMDNSLVRLKDENTAIGYESVEGSYEKVPLSYQYTSGSSGIISTASDMENFMIAHLNKGKFEENKILDEKTCNLMQNKQFSNSDVLPGMGYGFLRSNRNGQEIIKHEGALPGYTTTLFLMPKENLGIYIATNSLNPLPFNFEEKFLDYFYNNNNDEFDKISKNVNKDFSKYEGTYRSYDAIAKSNIMKIYTPFIPTMDMEIKDNKDGTLSLKEFTSAQEEIIITLIEKEEGVFARKDKRGDFAFKFDEKGNVTYAFNDISHNSFEKIHFLEQGTFIILVFIIAIFVFLLNTIITIASYIKGKFKSIKENTPKVIKILKVLNLFGGIFNIIGVFGVSILMTYMINNVNSSLIYLLYIFLIFVVVATILSFCSLIALFYFYFKNRGLRKVKIYFTIINVVNLIFIVFLYYFNFFCFRI